MGNFKYTKVADKDLPIVKGATVLSGEQTETVGLPGKTQYYGLLLKLEAKDPWIGSIRHAANGKELQRAVSPTRLKRDAKKGLERVLAVYAR